MEKIDKWDLVKKRVSLGVFFLGLGLFSFAPLRAQQEAKAVFVSMPDSLSPLLTAVNRADFIDFLESKMKANTVLAENAYNYILDEILKGRIRNDGSEQRLYSYSDDSAKYLANETVGC